VGWKVVAGSATGAGHQASGAPCQDACHWLCHGDWLIAVVCDGAGSARFSDVGARHAAQSLCRLLGDAVPEAGAEPPAPQSYWQAHIADAVAKTRETLESEHVRDGAAMRDFHATIVGIVMGPACGTFFQIGDGAGVALLDDEWEQSVLSLPENGEYADQTFFYTEERWREHLRFTEVSDAARLITLMTDGAMSFAMAPKCEGLERNFMEPVSRYLNRVDAETGSQALSATLDDPRTHAITSDDKTLIWARRER
jgi:hypothetical protein